MMNNPDEFQTLISIWNAISEETRSRFVDEYVDDLLYFDLQQRLVPGPNYGFDLADPRE
jgi:hypothetical protein